MHNLLKQLHQLQSIQPSPEWKHSERQVLLSKIRIEAFNHEVLKKTNYTKVWLKFIATYINPVSWVQSAGTGVLSLVFLFGTSVLTVSAAKNSLPGEMLYPVKRTVEQVQIALTSSDEGKAKLQVDLATKRAQEFNQVATNVLVSTDVDDYPSKASEKAVEQVQQAIQQIQYQIEETKKALDKVKQSSSQATTAQVIADAGIQTVKIEKAISKASQSLPDSVKDKVAQSVDAVLASTGDSSMQALLIALDLKDPRDMPIDMVTLVLSQNLDKIAQQLQPQPLKEASADKSKDGKKLDAITTAPAPQDAKTIAPQSDNKEKPATPISNAEDKKDPLVTIKTDTTPQPAKDEKQDDKKNPSSAESSTASKNVQQVVSAINEIQAKLKNQDVKDSIQKEVAKSTASDVAKLLVQNKNIPLSPQQLLDEARLALANKDLDTVLARIGQLNKLLNKTSDQSVAQDKYEKVKQVDQQTGTQQQKTIKQEKTQGDTAGGNKKEADKGQVQGETMPSRDGDLSKPNQKGDDTNSGKSQDGLANIEGQQGDNQQTDVIPPLEQLVPQPGVNSDPIITNIIKSQ